MRCTAVVSIAALAGISFGQGFAPVPLQGAVRFSYNKVSIPQGKETVRGKADFWLTDDAVLARVTDSDQIETTLLIRRDGTLLRDYRKNGASSISFYGRHFTPPRLALPFVWAEHKLLGRAGSQDQKGKLSYTYLALDPRVSRSREGDAVLDGEGRLKNLFWPSKQHPETTLTISGWQQVARQWLPTRIDLDIQQEVESVSVSWTLAPSQPEPVGPKEMTFEGQLGIWAQGGKKFLPINDCRVTITSCVGQTYTPDSYPLLMQIGSAGSESLEEPVKRQRFNTAYIVVLTAGTALLLWILLGKKKGVKS